MKAELDRWLALTPEEALEPDLPICDPHHHLWRSADPETGMVERYLLEDLSSDLGGGHHVVSTVCVECGVSYRRDGPLELRPVGETEFVEEIVSQNISTGTAAASVAAGIVGFADLTLGEAVTPVVEAHLQASPHRFRGIRHAVAWDRDYPAYGNAPPGLMGTPAFRAGFACLEKHDLTFDALIYHPQLQELADLAGAFPGVIIVVNHIGGLLGSAPKDQDRSRLLQAWKQDIGPLARYPNVVVKLGGFGMPFYGFGWSSLDKPPGSAELAKSIRPYVDFCIDRFGVDRCMFESNFPVDKVSFSYTVMWNAYKRLTSGFSPAERAALFRDTAGRVYKLGDSAVLPGRFRRSLD